jgi:hypothetical protein
MLANKDRLERVCFPHIKPDFIVGQQAFCRGAPESNFGPRHVYMATTNLINHHLNTDPTLAAPFSVPTPDLDALLQTSLQVDFGSDVTPIQIWANISRLARKGWIINREVLQSFVGELTRYMRCNG